MRANDYLAAALREAAKERGSGLARLALDVETSPDPATLRRGAMMNDRCEECGAEVTPFDYSAAALMPPDVAWKAVQMAMDNRCPPPLAQARPAAEMPKSYLADGQNFVD